MSNVKSPPARARTRLACLALLFSMVAAPAWSRDRFAVVVSGASGGPRYAENYERWRTALVTALVDKLGIKQDHVIVLAEDAPLERRATRESVTRAIASLVGRLTADDLLMVVLIGHGTFDGVTAKFNLVGPDLDAREWAQLLEKVPGQLIFVNTSGSSHPFLEALSGPGHIVITATDASAQRFDTVFPQFFAAALDQVIADADKNGRISIWEAFAHASHAVAQWYEQRGQLMTEHAVIDDNGDRTGKEAQVPGPDGNLARRVYLDPDPAESGADAVLAALRRRKVEIEEAMDALKARKGSMSPAQYEAEFEKLAVELARLERTIRARS